MSTIPEKPTGEDALVAEIAALKQQDPPPALSGAAKAAIVEAVALNAPAQGLWVILQTQVQVLLRPTPLATLGLAAVAGLMTGVFLPGLQTQNPMLTPEEELIAIYAPVSDWTGDDTLWADEGEVR